MSCKRRMTVTEILDFTLSFATSQPSQASVKSLGLQSFPMQVKVLSVARSELNLWPSLHSNTSVWLKPGALTSVTVERSVLTVALPTVFEGQLTTENTCQSSLKL